MMDLWKIDTKVWRPDKRGVIRHRQESVSLDQALYLAQEYGKNPMLISFLVSRQKEES